MGEFFGSVYCLFEDVFGLELANYLWGNLSPDQQTNMYVPIGFTMLAVSLLVCLLYYYIIDHPKLAKWWGWLIFLGSNAAVNFDRINRVISPLLSWLYGRYRSFY